MDGGRYEPEDIFSGCRRVLSARCREPRGADNFRCVGSHSKHFDPEVGELDRLCCDGLSCVSRYNAQAKVRLNYPFAGCVTLKASEFT
jgi:hypothetical protein